MEKLVSFVGAEEIYAVREKKEKIVLSERRKKGRDWTTRHEVPSSKKYFQEMDKKSRNLNIITSATVTLLTKAKLKDLERNTKKSNKTQWGRNFKRGGQTIET